MLCAWPSFADQPYINNYRIYHDRPPPSSESDELERRVITLFTRAHSATVLGFF